MQELQVGSHQPYRLRGLLMRQIRNHLALLHKEAQKLQVVSDQVHLQMGAEKPRDGSD